MAKIAIVYGSTTGVTQGVAEKLGAALGGDLINAADASAPALEGYDVLVLGCSTWGSGDLQDDWAGFIDDFEKANLQGKKVALFGSGDQEGFGDTFVDSLAILYDAAVQAGAQVIGAWPTDGYSATESRAVRDGKFVGLPIDENNQPDLTDERVDAWVKELKAQIG